jgi:hypothetical protein
MSANLLQPGVAKLIYRKICGKMPENLLLSGK